MDRCIAPDMTTSFFTRSVYVKTYRAEILSFWGFKSDVVSNRMWFQIGCGFKSGVVSISYYRTTILHKCAMCYAKIKRGFFSHYFCTISVLNLCTITQLFPIIRCGNIAFVFSKDPDRELLQHYIELGSEGRFHPSSNRLFELCSIIFIFV